MAVVRRIAGGWSDPTTPHADGWTIRGCPVNGPQLAAAGERVALAWYSETGARSRVRLAFSADGGAHFGDVLDVDATSPLGRADVEWLDDGTALVAWLGATDAGGEARVRLRRVAS